MKSLPFPVLLFFVFCLVAKSVEHKFDGHRLEATKVRRNAAEIREFHRQQRASKRHKNYVPTWPFEPVITHIQIGNSKQDFPVSLETGVDLAFVLDVSYPDLTDGQPAYDPSKSGGVDAGAFRSNTGGLDVYGEAYTDLVDFLSPMNLTFGSVQGTVDDCPPFVNISGVLGLQWIPDLKDDPVTSRSAPIFNIFAKLPEGTPRYIVQWMSTDGERMHTGFGYDLVDTCTSTPLVSAPLSYIYEEVSLSFKIDSFALGSDAVLGDAAKVDSGEPAILLNADAFSMVYYALYPDFDYDLGVYTTDCSNANVFADFVIKLKGVELRVPATNFVVDIGIGDGVCAVAFGYYNSDSTPFVFGLPFQRSYCVKLDIDNSEVSFLNPLSQQ